MGGIAHYKEKKDGNGLDQIPVTYIVEEGYVPVYRQYVGEPGLNFFECTQDYQHRTKRHAKV